MKKIALLATVFLLFFSLFSCSLDEVKDIEGTWKCEISEEEYFLLDFKGDRYVLTNYIKGEKQFIDGGKYSLVNKVFVFQFEHKGLKEAQLSILQAKKSGKTLTLTLVMPPEPGAQNQTPVEKYMEFKKQETAAFPFELKKPLNFTASKGNYNSITLKWDWDPQAHSYNIYRSQKKDSGFSPVAKNVTTTTWTDTSSLVANGGTFYYRIQSFRDDKVLKVELLSPYSDTIEGKTPKFSREVGTVTGLKVAPIIKTITKEEDTEGNYPISDQDTDGFQMIQGITLSWNKNPNADYYQVLRGDEFTEEVDGVSITKLNWVNCTDKATGEPIILTENSFNFYDLVFGEANQFKVVPYKINPASLQGQPDFVGERSNGVGFAKLPASLPDLNGKGDVVDDTNGTINLNWSALDGIQSYRIMTATKTPDSLTKTGFETADKAAKSLEYSVKGSGYKANNYQFVFWASAPLQQTKEVEGQFVADDSNAELQGKYFWFDLKKSINVGFWTSKVTVTEKTDKSITISWTASPDASVTEYKIFRQLSEENLKLSGNVVLFPKTIIQSVDTFNNEAIVKTKFTNNKYPTVSQLLFLGSVPKVGPLEFKDESKGYNRILPGQYRYYVVANNNFISGLANRNITDREFIQLVNRHLDRIMDQLYTEKNVTYTSVGTYKHNFANNPEKWNRSYSFNNFKSDYLTFTTPSFNANNAVSSSARTDIFDSSFALNYLPRFYYVARVGQLKVTSDIGYEGTINFNLARDWDHNKRRGGASWCQFGRLPGAQDLGASATTNRTQGWYVLSRGGKESNIRWDEGLAVDSYYHKSNKEFDSQSGVQQIKVEPNFTDDYVEWR